VSEIDPVFFSQGMFSSAISYTQWKK